LKNIFLIIGCIILFGTSAFFRKLAVDRVNPYQIQIISTVLYASLLPLWFFLLSKESNVTYPNNAIGFALICSFCNVLASVFFGFILKDHENPGIITALISLNPIVTLILTYIFFDRGLSLLKIIAFILALISAVLVSL